MYVLSMILRTAACMSVPACYNLRYIHSKLKSGSGPTESAVDRSGKDSESPPLDVNKNRPGIGHSFTGHSKPSSETVNGRPDRWCADSDDGVGLVTRHTTRAIQRVLRRKIHFSFLLPIVTVSVTGIYAWHHVDSADYWPAQ